MAERDLHGDHNVDYNKMMDNLPSNSKTVSTLNPDSQKREVKKIIKGEVKPQKKTFFKKFKDAFLPEPNMSVEDYILSDILVPGIKNLIYTVLTGGLSGALFGDARPDNRWRPGDNRYVDYSRMSTYRRDERRPSESSRATYRSRSVMNFEPMAMERVDAEAVLDEMLRNIAEYGSVSIGYYYELMGITGEFTDWKYGWVDLRNVPIIQARGGGYIIDFPKPIYIE